MTKIPLEAHLDKPYGDQTAVISTDFGTGTVEINYPFGDSLHAVAGVQGRHSQKPK